MKEQGTKLILILAQFGGKIKLNRNNPFHLISVAQGGVPREGKSLIIVNLHRTACFATALLYDSGKALILHMLLPSSCLLCHEGNKFLRVGKGDVDAGFKAYEVLGHGSVLSATKIPVSTSPFANWS